jgi:hypothetical protein
MAGYRSLAALLALWGLAAAPPDARAAEGVALLQALDKVTARISELKAPIGEVARFGTLEVTARACTKAPPDQPPENAAFLEIRELRRNEEPRLVFSGWMFSSTPGLSALEHPVYDIWVVDCLPAGSAAPAPPSAGE